MNSRQLQYAVLLSEVCNFSQVAEGLDISQPALSKQIIALENELGVKLFDRSTTPITLTPAGEFFIERARELLFEEDVLLKTMELYKNGKNGKLSIGISPFRSQYLMPPVVKALKERYPDLHISLCEYGRAQLHKGISEGLYDFAITNLPVDDAALDVIPLEKDNMVLAVPNALVHLISENETKKSAVSTFVDLADCENLPFVVVSRGQEMRQLFDKLCKIAKIHPTIYVEVVGITTAWTMVQAGLAATILPKQFIQADIASSNVTLFALNQNSYIRQSAIVTRKGQYVSEYAKYAIQLLTGQ
ncbi:MAG: LysR family transcriptional regulator [Clostridia bacterium]|nr:LysR family transcriptional regulator [Clostridia bacterium]